VFTTKVVPALTVHDKDKQKIQKSDIPPSFFQGSLEKTQKKPATAEYHLFHCSRPLLTNTYFLYRFISKDRHQ